MPDRDKSADSGVRTALARVDATRRPGFFRRALAAFGATRLSRFISRHVYWKLDPFLLRVSRGRIRSTLFIPSALLETVGAKTGAPRKNAVIYFHDGEDVVIAASNAGRPHHPSWYHNLCAHPDVTFGGVAMRARLVDDPGDRERLWALADNVFPAFASYRREASGFGRTIPLVRLTAR